MILTLGLNSRPNAVCLVRIHHGNDFGFNHPRMLDHLSCLLVYQRACGKADGGAAKPVVHLGTSFSVGLGWFLLAYQGLPPPMNLVLIPRTHLARVVGVVVLRIRVVCDDVGTPDTGRELEQ